MMMIGHHDPIKSPPYMFDGWLHASRCIQLEMPHNTYRKTSYKSILTEFLPQKHACHVSNRYNREGVHSIGCAVASAWFKADQNYLLTYGP